MYEEKFLKLVEENGGFEFCQAYRDDVDHILGGELPMLKSTGFPLQRQ